jgi:hypothetical protein
VLSLDKDQVWSGEQQREDRVGLEPAEAMRCLEVSICHLRPEYSCNGITPLLDIEKEGIFNCSCILNKLYKMVLIHQYIRFYAVAVNSAFNITKW